MNKEKLWLKIFNKKKYREFKNQRIKIKNKNLYDKNIKKKLDEISLVLENKNEISFLHSGHLGDIINSLPLINEVASFLNRDVKLSFFITSPQLVNPPRAVSALDFMGTFCLVPRTPVFWVIRTLQLESLMRLRRASGEKAPNTME